jgi:hypothetical protein
MRGVFTQGRDWPQSDKPHENMLMFTEVDPVCINQEDTEQGNQHMRQMRDISSAAKETNDFLGRRKEGSDTLLNAIPGVEPSL